MLAITEWKDMRFPLKVLGEFTKRFGLVSLKTTPFMELLMKLQGHNPSFG